MMYPLEQTNASRANNNSNNTNSLEISDDDGVDEDDDGCKGVLTEVYVRWPPVCEKHAS